MQHKLEVERNMKRQIKHLDGKEWFIVNFRDFKRYKEDFNKWRAKSKQDTEEEHTEPDLATRECLHMMALNIRYYLEQGDVKRALDYVERFIQDDI